MYVHEGFIFWKIFGFCQNDCDHDYLNLTINPNKALEIKKKKWEEMQIMNILVNKILFDSLRNKLADDG